MATPTLSVATVRARVLLNVCLLLAAAGLGAIVFLDPGKPAVEEPTSLLATSVEQIKRIRIERPGVDALALEHERGVWRMRSPYPLAVNQVRADAVARLADAPSFAQLAIDGDLAPYGLDNPTIRVVLDDKNLDFGGTDPLYQRRYVRVGDALHLIADGGYHHLLASPAGFVHPKPLGPDSTLTAIELRDMRLVHTAQGWSAETTADRVDETAIDALASAWKGAQATAVRRRDPTLSVEQIVTVYDERGTTTFEVARNEYELILLRVDAAIQYHLPLDTGRRLLSLGEPTDP